MLSIFSQSTTQTEQIGAALGRLLRAGDVIALSGDLGAGKTAFTRGVGLGFGALEAVTSPTFVLIHEHRRNADALRLHHLDCYRLAGTEDAALLGLEDIFSGISAAVIEWAERAADLLPNDHLWIDFWQEGENVRRLDFVAHGQRSAALLRALEAALNLTETSP
ncbi:MAG: tRNA (adenosine(37)-N6)-threonylcarbamoyltransferase complex ATPase subunit type 1 TsaE [Anaerolineae bacterium]